MTKTLKLEAYELQQFVCGINLFVNKGILYELSDGAGKKLKLYLRTHKYYGNIRTLLANRPKHQRKNIKRVMPVILGSILVKF